MLGVICAHYSAIGADGIVLQALLLTSAIFSILTAYVHITKKDFSFLGGGLFCALGVLILWGFINMFLPLGPMGRMVYSLAGAMIFVLYILYDTSLIMKHLSPDDYVIGAINLYLDIINLFLLILDMLNGRGD